MIRTFLTLFLLVPTCAAAGLAPLRQATEALPDQTFPQEVGRQIETVKPVSAVAIHDGNVFLGSEDGLFQLHGSQLVEITEVTGAVRKLASFEGSLWAFSPDRLHEKRGEAWSQVGQGDFVGVARFHSNIVVAGSQGLFLKRNQQLSPLTSEAVPFPIQRVATFNDSLYIQGGKRLSFFDGARFGGMDAYGFPVDLTSDWGALPSVILRDMLPAGPRLYLATDRGLGVLRGMTLSTIAGKDGLPFEDTLCLAEGFANDLWIGTTRGAIRKIGDDEYHYFSGQRWLPGDRVNAIAVADRAVYLATDRGLAIIEYHPMTLSAKAAYYEKYMETWGQKRLGFVHKLEWDDALQEYVREVSDNDGGFSADYLAAQSYRYAVTKDPIARQEAVNTFNALVWLEKMTGIPGFPARAVWVKGEAGHKSGHGSGGYPAEWHDVPGGIFEWKGDTSSDEICGHFYGVGLFLELAAQGDEIAQARNHLTRIASHLIDNKWQLIDLDGQPTRWGRWDPEYFFSEEGHFDHGLQRLELLSFMKTAAGFAGNTKFDSAYQKLVELGYPQQTLRQRVVFPADTVANFDDQLAFWSYWNLLRREDDPARKSVYRRSFERTWEILRIEQQPWFNFVYGALTGNDCEADQAVRHLREWPLDLVIWNYQNSHRADLRTPKGYQAIKAAPRAFSPREREPMRWDAWTMQADGGTDGRDVVEPSGWLAAYWMGRYHGFIAPPATEVQPGIQVQARRGKRPGAAAYNGPVRPR